MSNEHAPTLLLADDDDVLRERLARALRDRGYEVTPARSAEEALEFTAESSPEFAVIDLRMPGKGGLWLLQQLRARDAATRVLVLTGYGSIATAVEATRAGAVGYLPKPADADEVVRALLGDTGPTTEERPAPSLARAEWEHIQRVLTDCEGNISEAARRLGLHRRSLQRKLSKYPPRW